MAVRVDQNWQVLLAKVRMSASGLSVLSLKPRPQWISPVALAVGSTYSSRNLVMSG